ncbi:hypothetical protein SteCoe_13985 [Stentor coeruleus]|uniref:Uncharacterized protein n=1 Tax=Stentor coeruleus TaxID=5963 RepID=A0A1R2C762_9CILI|nr:hypothetical protein SteCoe_13985 [Stentor coeruleus]
MGNNLQQCIRFQEPQGITCDLTSATTEKNISKLMNENSQALVIMKEKNLEECLMDLSKEDLIQKIQELKEESKNTPKFINKTPLSDLLRADKAEDKEKLKRKNKKSFIWK